MATGSGVVGRYKVFRKYKYDWEKNIKENRCGKKNN